MNEPEGAQQWSAPQQHYDTMNQQVTDHDFTNFLDLGDLGDLEFSFDSNGAPTRESSQQLNDLPDANVHQHHVQQFRPAQHSGASQEHTNAFYDMSMPMYANAQQQYAFSSDQQRFVPHNAIPPTPNSLDIHAGARYAHGQHPHHAQRQMDPQNQTVYQLRKDDAASFTPLVSPAVTPHEAAFRVPQEFTVPGAYFSPLSSPALEAQRKKHMQHTPGYSGSSAATSPADIDIDMLENVTQDTTRKAKNRTSGSRRNAPRSSAASSKVSQSPIHRARRKSKPTQSITPKDVALLREAEAGRSSDAKSYSSGLDVPHRSHEGSEASISPEPLTEASMGPPPRPGSTAQSPNITGKRAFGVPQGVAPATPASLMRLQASPDGLSPMMPGSGRLEQNGTGAPVLEDLALPEAVISRPIVSRGASLEDLNTPRMTARKTPKLNPLMTPSSGAALSGRPSPMLSALTSPTTPMAQSPITGRKGSDVKGRMNKKRNSTSSALVSPALLPKISPSIKPLLPDGAQGMTDDQHALLLATKSNYQNILEGTHVPGVSYPEALSTNLTSKRTSHKIAEQGRRNRINTALQEMQSLLPSPSTSKGCSKSPSGDAKSPEEDATTPGGKGSAAAQGNSKAATVELAIDYIKSLQKEKAEQDSKMRDKDRELEELRKKMGEMEGRLRADSESSN